MRLAQSLSKSLSFLPWLTLGPLTGPLAWRMTRCLKTGDRLLAGLYGAAIVTLWVDLAALSGRALISMG